jgi:hypothetical protein
MQLSDLPINSILDLITNGIGTSKEKWREKLEMWLLLGLIHEEDKSKPFSSKKP